jgi:hypothetical protein
MLVPFRILVDALCLGCCLEACLHSRQFALFRLPCGLRMCRSVMYSISQPEKQARQYVVNLPVRTYFTETIFH